MLIDQGKAQHFQDQYQTLLGHVALVGKLVKPGQPADSLNPLALMQTARDALVQDRSLLGKAAAAMAQAGDPLSPEMAAALTSLRVSHWVYLRNTTAYSVFLETGALEAAYAVKGLSQSIRDIMGDSGAIIEAGLLEYDGCIVCDELIVLGAWLGAEYRSSFNEQLRELRASGKFNREHLLPEPTKNKSKSKR